MANTFKEYLQDFGSMSLFGFDSTTGTVIPQTKDVLEAVKELFRNVFNLNINIEDETPAGRLCEAFAMMIVKFCATTAHYANQINPNYATGQVLDAIGSLFSVVRSGATRTVIYVTLHGTAGTVVPDGSIIQTKSGKRFFIQGNQTIANGGTTSCTAASESFGNVQVDVGEVTEIVSSVAGWSAVSNTGVSLVGGSMESDSSLRKRIINARWTGTAFTQAIRAAVENQRGVDTAFVVDNGNAFVAYYTEAGEIVLEQPSSGKYIALAPHSVCVIVYGLGLQEQDYSGIAQAIYSTKSAGCGFTGLDNDHGTAITSSAIDPINRVSYPIVFNRPKEIHFNVHLTVKRGSYVDSDERLVSDVRNAVTQWATGETPFVDGLDLGQSLYAFEIGAAVSDVIPAIQIKGCGVRLGSASQEYNSVELFVNEIGVLDKDSITVSIVS